MGDADVGLFIARVVNNFTDRDPVGSVIIQVPGSGSGSVINKILD